MKLFQNTSTIVVLFAVICFIRCDTNNLPNIRQKDGEICIGGHCVNEKQMAEMQTFLKPLFEKMYKKVFENNPKYAHIQNMSPEAVAADPKLSQELQNELMKAAYEELKDKNIDEVMSAMSHLKVDENVNTIKRQLKKTFDEYDADGNGLISYMDVADILNENDDEDSFTDEEINHLIHDIDKDKSGNINFKEFKQLFPKTQKRQMYEKKFPKIEL